MLRVDADGLVEVLYRSLVLTEVVISVTPQIVGISVLRVETDGLVEVLYRPLVLT